MVHQLLQEQRPRACAISWDCMERQAAFCRNSALMTVKPDMLWRLLPSVEARAQGKAQLLQGGGRRGAQKMTFRLGLLSSRARRRSSMASDQ